MAACLQCGAEQGWFARILGPLGTICGACCRVNGYRYPLGLRFQATPIEEATLAGMVDQLRALVAREDLQKAAPRAVAALQGTIALWDNRMTTPDDSALQGRLQALLQDLIAGGQGT